MAVRAERLGDRGPSAPERWEEGFGTGRAHVLVTLYAEHDAQCGRDRARGAPTSARPARSRS